MKKDSVPDNISEGVDEILPEAIFLAFFTVLYGHVLD